MHKGFSTIARIEIAPKSLKYADDKDLHFERQITFNAFSPFPKIKMRLSATAGLLYVLTKIKDPSFSEENFNKWYSTVHIQDINASGLSDLAIRYKNVNPAARWPYLAVYRVPDIAKFNDKNITGSIPMTHELLPAGKNWKDLLESDSRPFTVLQKFEGQIKKEGEFNSKF